MVPLRAGNDSSRRDLCALTDGAGADGIVLAMDGPRQLFVVGSPRTGSTLLRHVLNRSPHVCLASETHFLKSARRLKLGEQLAAAREGASNRRRAAADQLVRDVYGTAFWAWLRRNVEPDTFSDRLLATDLTERALFDLLLQLYVEVHCHDRAVTIRGEKTPDHLYGLGTLAAWFPDAQFIHTFRDPRAIYASRIVRSKDGRRGMKARLPQVPARLLTPLLAPFEVAETSRVWLDAARLHRRYERMLGGRYRLVRFEDLVTQPEATMRGVCEFIGIPFEATILEETVVVGSSFEQERHASGGFDQRSVDRWRTRVHPLVSTWFGVVGRRELKRFGYRP
jgi:Sulfotransferase family